MHKIKRYINSFYKIVFIIILYELVIGGSGRYFEVGPVTFRMIFYFLAIILGIIYFIFKKKIKIEIVLLLTSFTLLLFTGFIIGVINGSSLIAIFEDIKPLLFFYILIYFDAVINNFDDIKRIITIIKTGSIFLSISYFVILILLSNGVIDFIVFYEEQKDAGEILFRNDLFFFYKGFLYLCVGFFFFLLSKSNKNRYLAVLIFIAILLTLTRGFILFTFLITSYYILFLNRDFKVKAIFLIFTILIAYNIIPYLTEILGDKSDSDRIRIVNFYEVIDRVNPASLLIGHGFGYGVPSRPIHMEISYLEIFHKQGLIGLLFWLILFFYIIIQYFKININYKYIAMPFLLSVIFIYLQSLTNPFMNNPIGLTMILLTIVVFSKIIKIQNQ
jgi:hypothetical protein